jgi:PAS domain S-box-containing protein
MFRPKRGSWVAFHLIAVISVAAATSITVWSTSLFKIHSLWAFMLAVYFTAFAAGFWPSVLALVLSSFSWAYFVAPPDGFGIGQRDDQIRLLTFIILALIFSFLYSSRVNAEKKVRSLVQRLRLALDGTRVGVWDLNLDTGAVWHSLSMEEIFGRHGDRFTQAYEVFIGYIHPEDRDFVHRTVTHAIEHGDEFHIQYRILKPEGEARWVTTHGRVFFDNKGHPERLVAATEDMTNRPTIALAPSARQSPLPAPAPREPVTAHPG